MRWWWLVLSGLALASSAGCGDCVELRAQMNAVTEQTQSCMSDGDCVEVDGASGTSAPCGVALNQKNAATLSSLMESFRRDRCSAEVVHCPSPAQGAQCRAGICEEVFATSSSARGRR